MLKPTITINQRFEARILTHGFFNSIYDKCIIICTNSLQWNDWMIIKINDGTQISLSTITVSQFSEIQPLITEVKKNWKNIVASIMDFFLLITAKTTSCFSVWSYRFHVIVSFSPSKPQSLYLRIQLYLPMKGRYYSRYSGHLLSPK